VLLSIPLVVYHTWIKDSGGEVSIKSPQAYMNDLNRPNIILVSFDALATKNMTLYGYKRHTTPFMSTWAENASVFTNVKAGDGYTTPTTASLMTGKRVWTHQTYHQRSAILKGPTENIAYLLKESGYYTMAYAENKNASPVSLNVYNSFNDYKSFIPEDQDLLSRMHARLYHLFFGKIKLYDWIFLDDFAPTHLFKKLIYYPLYYSRYKKSVWEEKKAVPVKIDTILDKFTDDIDKNNYTAPFFVWLHMMPPHEPYLPPEPFMGTFDSSSIMRTLDEQFEYRIAVADHLRNSGQFTKEDLKLLETYRARYDENILFCDSKFEDFITQLTKRNILNNSVVILSADHGEIFEHNSLGHGGVFYEPVLSVPLIINRPNQTEGIVIDDIIEQIDIPATILDIADISLPSWMEGRSLVPLLNNGKLAQRPAFAMHLEANRRRGNQIKKGLFAVWEEDYKLIHDLEKGESLLFNLKNDPDEQVNLINKEPEVGKHLLELIHDNLKKANEKIISQSDL
jgi:arylsulfatase A-like enzyme